MSEEKTKPLAFKPLFDSGFTRAEALALACSDPIEAAFDFIERSDRENPTVAFVLSGYGKMYAEMRRIAKEWMRRDHSDLFDDSDPWHWVYTLNHSELPQPMVLMHNRGEIRVYSKERMANYTPPAPVDVLYCS